MRPALPLLLLTMLLGACATSREPAPSAANAVPAAPESAFDKARSFDRIVVAGQPTLADLKSLKERGIVQVFNVRGTEEMTVENIGFDERAELAALGIAYSTHPIDKAEAYTTELLAAFAKQVDASNGKILLHCTVGWRASNVYAAYAMKYLGKTPDEAAHLLEAVGGWPHTLERLTGERLTLVRSEDLTKLGFEN